MVEWDYARLKWIRILLTPLGIILIYVWGEYGLFKKFGDISFFIMIIIFLIVYLVLIFLFAREK